MKTEVVGCRAGKGFVLFFDVDRPYDDFCKTYFNNFSKSHKIPLVIVKSSDRGFHVISFNIFEDPQKITDLQEEMRETFPGTYPNLHTCLNEYDQPYGNVLRIGFKNLQRPDKLLDQFMIKTAEHASDSHVRLYEILTKKFINIKQPRKETKIQFLETNLDKVLVPDDNAQLKLHGSR